MEERLRRSTGKARPGVLFRILPEKTQETEYDIHSPVYNIFLAIPMDNHAKYKYQYYEGERL